MDAEKPMQSGGPTMDEQLFGELVALLSQMLVMDYQRHSKITVGSPPLSSRKDYPNLQ
jgi:hypothetical protein